VSCRPAGQLEAQRCLDVMIVETLDEFCMQCLEACLIETDGRR
jgi:hypothetical protein